MGTLKSINFHRDDFNLSPHMTRFVIRDDFRQVVLMGIGEETDFERFDVPLNRREEVGIDDLPQGDYAMQIQTASADKYSTFTLSFINYATGAVDAAVTFDHGRFMRLFEMAKDANDGGQLDVGPDGAEFDMAWSIAYLKRELPILHNAPEEFWQKFAGSIDMAFMPINFQWALNQLPPAERPEFVVEHQPDLR